MGPNTYLEGIWKTRVGEFRKPSNSHCFGQISHDDPAESESVRCNQPKAQGKIIEGWMVIRGDRRKPPCISHLFTWMSQEVSKWLVNGCKWVITYLYMGYIGVITHLLTIY